MADLIHDGKLAAFAEHGISKVDSEPRLGLKLIRPSLLGGSVKTVQLYN